MLYPDRKTLDSLMTHARKYARRYISWLFDPEDVEGAALDALAYALETYDPTKGAKLKTYLGYCVNYLCQNARRDVICAHYGQPRPHYDARRPQPMRIPDECVENELRGEDWADAVVDHIFIERAISGLRHPRAREVIQLYYLEGLTLRLTGKLLGCSPQRVRQIRDKALKEIRFRYGGKDAPNR